MHENENPFLSIVSNSKVLYKLSQEYGSPGLITSTELQQKVYYSCRRSSGHLYLGIIGSTPVDRPEKKADDLVAEDSHPYGLTPVSAVAAEVATPVKETPHVEGIESLVKTEVKAEIVIPSIVPSAVVTAAVETDNKKVSPQSSVPAEMPVPIIQSIASRRIGFSGNVTSGIQLCSQLQAVSEISHKPSCPRSKNIDYGLLLRRVQIRF